MVPCRFHNRPNEQSDLAAPGNRLAGPVDETDSQAVFQMQAAQNALLWFRSFDLLIFRHLLHLSKIENKGNIPCSGNLISINHNREMRHCK